MTDLFAYLKERPYPGRGILLGATPAGKAVCAYFIMGRSETAATASLKKPPTASAPARGTKAR